MDAGRGGGDEVEEGLLPPLRDSRGRLSCPETLVQDTHQSAAHGSGRPAAPSVCHYNGSISSKVHTAFKKNKPLHRR